VGRAQRGEAAEGRGRVQAGAREQQSAVAGVYVRLSWGLFASPVWLGRRGRAHLMGPVRVPEGEGLRPLEEAGIAAVRVSGQR